MKNLQNCFVASCCLAVALAAAPVMAESAGAGQRVIEEIVVTAQKRTESLQDVPMSITAVSGDQLAARQIYDPSQLQFIAPSLQLKAFNAALGAQNFSIRGVGTMSFSPTIDASVTSVVDGVAMGNPAMGIMNFMDVERIEVLNGPQGMLFGKNASAGIVNITSKAPVLGEYEGSLRAEYGQMSSPGSGNQYVAQGVLNVPIGSDAALRLNASRTHNDPLIKNRVRVPGSKWDQDQNYFKGKFLWEGSDSLRVFVAGDYARSTGVGSGSAADRLVLPGSAWEPENVDLGIVPSTTNAYSSYGAPTDVEFTIKGAQVNVDYTFPSGHVLTNILAWREFEADNLFDSDKHRIDFLDTNWQVSDMNQVTGEIRLSSPTGDKLDYQLGLYYYRGETDGTVTVRGANGVTDPIPPGFDAWFGIIATSAMVSRSYAVFGQATYHFSDDFRLLFGGRYTRDDLELESLNDATGVVVPLGAPGSRDQKTDETDFSWRVSGQYDLNDNLMLYVTAARGYKGPGFNSSLNPAVGMIDPETVTMYEVGVKSTLLDRRLLLNASAYTSKYKDFQSQAFDDISNGYILLNAGSLRSRGAELEVLALATDNLSFNAGVSYVDAYYTSFPGDRCWVGQPGCAANSTIDSTDNRLPNAPRWTVTLSGNYARPITDTLEGFIQVSSYTRSSMNFSSNANPYTVQSGYALFDASIGIASMDDTWRASLFCRNCSDKRFATFINASSQTRTDYYHMFGLNSFRTVGLALTRNF